MVETKFWFVGILEESDISIALWYKLYTGGSKTYKVGVKLVGSPNPLVASSAVPANELALQSIGTSVGANVGT